MRPLLIATLILTGLGNPCKPAYAEPPTNTAAELEAAKPKPLAANDPLSTLAAFFAEVKQAKISALPQTAELARLRTYLTQDLLTLLQQAQHAEQVCIAAAAPGDKPSIIEGDLFSGNVDGYTEVAYGKVTVSANHARVALSFMNIDQRFPHAHPFRSFVWPAEAVLQRNRQNTAWLISDLRFFSRRSLGHDLRDYLATAKRDCSANLKPGF